MENCESVRGGIRRPACRTSSAGDKPQPYIFLSIAGVAGTV